MTPDFILPTRLQDSPLHDHYLWSLKGTDTQQKKKKFELQVI